MMPISLNDKYTTKININGKPLDIKMEISSQSTEELIPLMKEENIVDKMAKELVKEIDKKIFKAVGKDYTIKGLILPEHTVEGKEKIILTGEQIENRKRLNKYITDSTIFHMLSIIELYSRLNTDINILQVKQEIEQLQKLDFDCETGITLLVEQMEILTEIVKSSKENEIEADDFELIDIS